jgi:hypothetical protein
MADGGNTDGRSPRVSSSASYSPTADVFEQTAEIAAQLTDWMVFVLAIPVEQPQGGGSGLLVA